MARGIAPAAALDQVPIGLHALEPGGEGARAGEHGKAPLALASGREVEADVEMLGLEPILGALRPFDERDGILGHLVPAELHQLVAAREAVEIRMDDGRARTVIDLHQGEGRARDLQLRLAGEKAHEGAGQRRLAGAEAAGQGHEIAGFQLLGQNAREALRRCVVGKRHDPCGLRNVLLGHEGQSVHHR